LALVGEGLRIGSLHPPIFGVLLQLVGIFLMVLLQIFDSLVAGNSSGDQVLFVAGQVFIHQVSLASLPSILVSRQPLTSRCCICE
jgi:hypothetical protein